MTMNDARIRNNPFVVAGKIPPELFCDRRVETERFVREVTNGNNLVLISPRRMGKTGLIQHCFGNDAIIGKYETFYIDILQTSSLKELAYLLGKEIFQRLASKSEKMLRKFMSILRSIAGSFGYDPFNGLPTLNLQLGDISDPEMTMGEIFRYIAESESSVIVAIDEFQQICNYKEKNVEAMLRSHIQRLANAIFVFAGSEQHLLRQMFCESARPFYNSASIMELTPIEMSEYAKFSTGLFEEAGKSLDADTVAYVYDTFGGNTFYLQKIFNLAFSKTGKGENCDIEIAEESIVEMLASYDTLYREILSGVGDSQKQLLIALAREGEAREIMSAEFMKKYSLPTASAVQAASKRLASTGLISRVGSTYRVQDPMLRMWLLRTY